MSRSDQNETTIKEALEAMVKSLKLKPKMFEAKIETIWRQRMGASISKDTTSVRLRKGRLYLSMDSAALKQELSYSKVKIMKMLNRELGEDFIKEVMIR